MRHRILAALLTFVVCDPAFAAGDGPPAPIAADAQSPKTAKERLSDKGSDEQRVDDCKVPKERRTRARPVSCPWDVGS